MRRPAIWRFGLAWLAVAACWSDRGGQSSTIENRSEALAARDLSGAYWCSIEDSGYKYPPFPCAIRKLGGHFVLAKLAGSQRFEGEVRSLGQGFSFDGQFYCPWGDCTQPLHGTFRPAARGTLRGTFRDAAFVVTMQPAPDNAFGGIAYGGDGYGGFGAYGGQGYGGAGYGAVAPSPPPRNRRP